MIGQHINGSVSAVELCYNLNLYRNKQIGKKNEKKTKWYVNTLQTKHISTHKKQTKMTITQGHNCEM